MNHERFDRNDLAAMVAAGIPAGSFVNLGIGLPTRVVDYLPEDKNIILHTENGMLGMGPSPLEGEEDDDCINAGKQPVTIMPGGSFFHHADSFAMMRGGHLDYCVMGAFQVSETGDLANWHTGDPHAIPAVGGAMDLAIGAKNVWVMMDLFTKKGECKLVRQCTYPLTGIGCIKRVYTDCGVFDVTEHGFQVRRLPMGLDFQALGKLANHLHLIPAKEGA